ncbi:2OG-Fe(II) oxygenase [Kordiimonas aestuarii]|uniref:2OG-Fe(II) oxygenase n=1 Tax=Kordiimonas aestuarii TaxID=1005925 RepID=UPI0021CF6729|nr:2OG-Fe(II) oxygenase [Kordiimonas aestuarii]
MAPRGDISFFPGAGRAGAGFQLAPAVIHGFLTADECACLQAYATDNMMVRARLAGGASEHAIRSAGALWLDEDTMPWLATKLVRSLAQLSRDSFPFDFDGFGEGLQLLRYDGGGSGRSGDFYDWHIDIGGAGSTTSRKLSIVVQLSDPAAYEGGQLEVNAAGDVVQLPAVQGTLVAFPSFMLHRVRPVTAGTRFSMAAWVHGPAFR